MKNVIWLTGMPRSGTTWISQIFASNPDIRVKFCPLFSYAFKNALNEKSTGEEWLDFFSRVYDTSDDYMDQWHLRDKELIPDFPKSDHPSILLIKSNRFHNLTEVILQKCPDVRFASIIRHPCAVIHSWLSNPLEFPEDQDPMQQWRTGACRKTGPGEFWGFEDWKRVTSMHLRLARKWPERFLIRKYADFSKSPIESTTALFRTLNLEVTKLTQDFILSSQSRHDEHRRSIYKVPSHIDIWKNSLNKDIVAAIYEEIKDTELDVFLED